MERTTDNAREEARWREVAARLEADGPWLIGQGCVVAKRVGGGRTAWVVRYRVGERGESVHRTVYLGGDERGVLRRRARALLARFRRSGQELAQLPTLVRLAGRLNAVLKRRFREA